MQKLLPDIRQLSQFCVFQQDSKLAHRARDTVDHSVDKGDSRLHSSFQWPPNSPDWNPVDYKVWSVMQEKVYKGRIKDVCELRSHILTAWHELDQRVIDMAVRQWRPRLRACVKAKARILWTKWASSLECCCCLWQHSLPDISAKVYRFLSTCSKAIQ